MATWMVLVCLVWTGQPDRARAEAAELVKQFAIEVRALQTPDLNLADSSVLLNRLYDRFARRVRAEHLPALEGIGLTADADSVRWPLIRLLAERERFDGAAALVVRAAIVGRMEQPTHLLKWWETTFGKRADCQEFTHKLFEALLRHYEMAPVQEKTVVASLVGARDRSGKLSVEELKNSIGYRVMADTPARKQARERQAKIQVDRDRFRDGEIAVSGKSAAERLRFYFDYVGQTDEEISGEVNFEFGRADLRTLNEMVKRHGDAGMRERLRKRLTDPKTPVYALGQPALLLGMFEQKEDSELLARLLQNPETAIATTLHDPLAGYVLADPKEGWAYFKKLISDAKGDFGVRYAGLRAIRILRELGAKAVRDEEYLKAMEILLDQADIMDMVIEDLRRAKEWRLTTKVIASVEKPTEIRGLIQRAALHYMLDCPQDKYPEAGAFVAKARREKPKLVESVEEALAEERAKDRR